MQPPDSRMLLTPIASMPAPGVALRYPPMNYPPAPNVMGVAPLSSMGMGMQALHQLPGIEVRERANPIQELTALLGYEIDMAHRYQVLDTAGNEVFYAVERTDWCRRQMQQSCCHDCASWETDVLYTFGGFRERFLSLRRPCSLTCCCFNRPHVNIIDELTQRRIGSIQDPWACCGMRFSLRDAEDREVLSVYRGCCHPGLLCPLPCGPCSRVLLEVRDTQCGATVAHVEKRVPSMFAFLFTPDIDNYRIEFQAVQDPEWKAMLLGFALFMDFRYFSYNRNNSAAARRMTDNALGDYS